MSWQVVRLADVTATPWRNGGGTTRELAAAPAGEAWIWRMSVAEVAQGGPFSRFDGIDRWFAVLEGAGVELDIAGHKQRLAAGDGPLFFDGAASTDCRLIDGATQDFNLMVRRPHRASHMRRVDGLLDRIVIADSAGRTVAVYTTTGATVAADGVALELPAASLAWRRLERTTRITIEAQHALWMEITA